MSDVDNVIGRHQGLPDAMRVKTTLWTVASTLSVLALSTPSMVWAQASSSPEEFDLLRKQLEELARQVESQAERIDDQAAEIERLTKALATAEVGEKPGQSDAASPSIALSVDSEGEAGALPSESGEEAAQAPLDTVAGAAPDAFDEERVGRYPDRAIVRSGDFDGSISLSGLGGSLRVGGMVRSELSFDLDNAGNQDGIIPLTVPLDNSTDDGSNQTQFNARNSQISVDYRRATDRGLLRTFIEIDFFGDGTEFDNDYGVRLRHAAVGLGNLQFGQFWSLFTNLAATPEVGELIGPHGAPVFRTPGLRWYDTIGDDWNWAIGIENPAGDISGESPELASESVPNLVGYLERRGDWGHIRLSGLGVELQSSDDRLLTGAASLSGQLSLTSISRGDNVMFGAQYGSGFAKQYAGFGDAGLEGVVDAEGNLDATEILGAFVSYQHWWSDSIRSTAYVSFFDFDQGLAADPESLDFSFKTAANLYWSPVNNTAVGAEVVYVTRETIAGDEGSGVRLQAIAQFNF